MEPEFLEKFSLSEEDKETFLRFYNKSLYYEDMWGHLRRVSDKVFEAIARKWDILYIKFGKIRWVSEQQKRRI